MVPGPMTAPGAQPHRPESFDSLLAGHVSQRADALAVADAPNRGEILAGDPGRLTWEQLDDAVDGTAAMLAGCGAEPGTPVACQLPNTVELVTTLLACFRLGAVAVPFPIQHREHELRGGLELSDAEVFVTAVRPDRADQLDIVASAVGRCGHDVTVIDLGDAPRGSGPVTARPHGPDDTATICWTSGTTGTPKGVPRTTAMWLTSATSRVGELGLTNDDRILCPFPLVNMAGIGGMLVPWLVSGAALHLHQPLNLPVFLSQIAAEQITYTVAPPAILNMLLLEGDGVDWSSLSSLRCVASGAAPLDPWMVEGWAERGVEIVNIFGSNEGASLISTAAVVPDPSVRAQCFPQPDPARVETRLVDLGTEEEILEEGRVGELRFRGPTVFDGYLASTFEEFDGDGFFRTGDLFEWADAGSEPRLLRFVDRAKDIIIRGGMNVSAAELEALIMESGLLAECAVVGYPDPELGQRVRVVGVPATADPALAEPALADVVDHLRALGVASYKLPERLDLVDALPRNGTGKVLKGELRTAEATGE